MKYFTNINYRHSPEPVEDYHPAKDIHERGVAAKDMAAFFCGELLGRGLSRWVYTHKHSKRFVIKFEPNQKPSFQNVGEWLLWDKIRYEDIAKWFAPVYDISSLGHFLIQARVRQCSEKRPSIDLLKKYPKQVPALFQDVKPGNFGFLSNGRFVCCDYSMYSLAIFDQLSKKKTLHMRKINWADFVSEDKTL